MLGKVDSILRQLFSYMYMLLNVHTHLHIHVGVYLISSQILANIYEEKGIIMYVRQRVRKGKPQRLQLDFSSITDRTIFVNLVGTCTNKHS